LIPYTIHPLAECDIHEAALYFDRRSSGLGKQFRLSLEEAIRLLQQFPEIAPVVRGNLRCKNILRFKYNLIYAVEDAQINIYVVVSQHRRPESWLNRFPETDEA
jgi:toxin ParE1/3/4